MNDSRSVPHRSAWAVPAVWTLAVLLVTLFPYDPLPGAWSELAVRRVRWTAFGGGLDLLLNLLMLMPWGAALARTSGWNPLRVAGAATALALAVEAGQVVLPGRHPSALDVAANLSGAWAGAWLVQRLPAAAMRRPRPGRRTVLAAAGLALVLHCGLVALAARHMRGAVHLAGWDPSCALVVGDEATGQRAWRGHVVSVRAWTTAGGVGEPILDLVRQGDRYADGAGGPGLAPTPGSHTTWQGAAAGARLSRLLSRAGAFRFDVVFSSADTNQSGPARIVTLSRDPWFRNLTLGQEGPDLVVRLRTPVTGPNGNRPELILPQAFRPGESTRVRIAFDGRRLSATTPLRAATLDLGAWSLVRLIVPRPLPEWHAGYSALVSAWRVWPLLLAGCAGAVALRRRFG